jgi:hypothetical protein
MAREQKHYRGYGKAYEKDEEKREIWRHIRNTQS